MVHDADLDLDAPAADGLSPVRAARRGAAAGIRAARVSAVGLLAAGSLLAVGWRVAGGRIYTVQSASMGTAAPVGALLLDRSAGRLSVGELISFHPPGSDAVFTHRIVGFTPTGDIETKGDVNGARDGWQLPRSAVLGRVIAVLPGVGWLVRAVPILLAGTLLVWLLTRRWVQEEWRPVLRASGTLVVAVVALSLLHPLFGSDILVFARAGGGAGGSVVSSGLLPVRVSAVGGTSVTIGQGAVAHVWTAWRTAQGRYQLTVEPSLAAWWIVPLVLLLFTPALISLGIREAPDGELTRSPSPHA